MGETPLPPGNPDPKHRGALFSSMEFDDAEHWYSFSLPEAAAYTAGLDRGVLYLQLPEKFSNVYVFYEMALINPDVRRYWLRRLLEKKKQEKTDAYSATKTTRFATKK